ncbi:PREDICTED: LOW QUALITY PROTEIN: tumor necrosis factor receptor superfamily member 10D-like [Rhinopithecus bieti]|uniref:LOW QUALITY PROTEIN: tumor necrosis factor receptor superfamily member 10D-like n=1 Tax=Rhinopithecus bieti TaxID=61621 RepID=UPI00083C36C5|nr:PREDICTED: LOW QUALITY PROTEIN: tumor necrosis factor receptor superfamily member 10D-like [Rhinopithecus bieti]
MGLCGQSAPTASSARAGRYPGARTASGTTSWRPKPKTLSFVHVILLVLLSVQVDSNTISRQDKAPPPPVVSQQQSRSLKEECPAGFYRSEHTRACNPCTQGVEYTNASNSEPSCLPCAVCKSGTECVDLSFGGGVPDNEVGVVVDMSQGTKFQPNLVFITLFHDYDFDEEEMSPCTTTSNTVCQCKPGSFRNGNSTEMCRKCSTGPTSAVGAGCAEPQLPGVTSLEGIGDGRSSCQLGTLKPSPGCGLEWAVCLPKVFFWCSCPSRVMSLHGTEDNAHNETLSTRFLQPQVSEQEIEGQEPAEPTGVTVQSPEEPQRLLEQAEAEACQRRTLPVPVNGADPTEINTLLDASATLEEGHAKETIQDHMVDSEKLFYEEDDAGFATSSL